jgi:hypothetical protein
MIAEAPVSAHSAKSLQPAASIDVRGEPGKMQRPGFVSPAKPPGTTLFEEPPIEGPFRRAGLAPPDQALFTFFFFARSAS